MTVDVSPADRSLETHRITLRALIAARWVLLVILIAAGFAGRVATELEGLRWFDGNANAWATFVTVFVWGALNLATRAHLDRLARLGNLAAGLHLLIDTIGISLLLAWSGGASNPFTILFFLPITLATQVSPRWTWIVAGASVLLFGGLLLASTGGGHEAMSMGMSMDEHARMGHVMPAGSAPVEGGHYAGHLRGMWLALGLSGAMVTYFVHRIATAIALQRAELGRLRETAHRDRELARIGSLAAGAAHELGTPLATATILAGELDRMSETERRDATAAIIAELGRCKDIIGAMATPELRAGSLSSDDIEPWSLQALDVGDDPLVRYRFDGDARPVSIAPKAALAKIVAELVANAKAASPPGAHVRVRAASTADGIELRVEDDGSGMTPELASSATAPFFTTKQGPGNMGLGLFLIEAQVRSLGGQLTIDSRASAGTTVRVHLPHRHGGP